MSEEKNNRYLIIDLRPENKENLEWISTTQGEAFKGEILDHEESLTVFKNVWNEGKEAGMECTPLEKDYNEMDYADMEKYWEGFKETL